MIEKFKVDFRSHIRTASPIFLMIGIGLVLGYVFTVHAKTPEAILAFMIGMLIMGLPVILLHINYYRFNRGYTLSYEHQQRKVVVNDGKNIIGFDLDDIEKVVKFISPNLHAGRSSFLPWDDFNYSIIYLNNGQAFIITSLLVPNLKISIDDHKIIIKHRLFRFVRLKS